MNQIEEIKYTLKKSLHKVWDADHQMEDEYVLNSPLGVFAQTLHNVNPSVLERLTYFSALKALPCWEFHLDGTQLRERLRKIRNVVHAKLSKNQINTRSISSTLNDCRYSETQGAADAIAYCAKYLETGNPIFAIYSLSGADCAYDHIYTNDDYRNWLIDVALDIAVDNDDISEDALNEKSEKRKKYAL